MKRAVLACVLLLACRPEAAPGESPPAASASDTLVVYAVNEPLRYFASRIGGERVEAVFPAPPGVDPTDWSPGGELVAAYQRADLILLNGLGYAGWTSRASLPRATQVDTTAAFSDRLIPIDGAVTHQHGPSGAHSHQGVALTTWLDPALAALQARAVAAALTGARPRHEAFFAEGLASLEADLADLDRRLREATARIGDTRLIFSHPVYPYLQRAYGLNGRSLHWEPDQTPSERQWRELSDLLGEYPAQVLLWEGEPLAATRERLEALGLRSVVYAPAGKRSDAGDWLTVMQANAARLEALGASVP